MHDPEKFELKIHQLLIRYLHNCRLALKYTERFLKCFPIQPRHRLQDSLHRFQQNNAYNPRLSALLNQSLVQELHESVREICHVFLYLH